MIIVINKAPFIHSKNSLKKYIFTIFISLLFPIAFGFYKNGIKLISKDLISNIEIIKPLLFPILGFFTCCLSEFLYTKIKKKNFKIFNSLFSVSGLIIGCLMPPQTNIFLFVILLLILSFLVQFIHFNINKCALMSLILILIITYFFKVDFYNLYESANAFAPTTGKLFLGFDKGGINATSCLFLIFSYIFLSTQSLYKKDTSFYFILTMFILCSISFFFNHSIYKSYLPILSFNTLFSGIYILTDIKSCPTNKIAKVIYGIVAALLSFILIKLTGFFSSVILVITILSILNLFIDKIFKKNSHI